MDNSKLINLVDFFYKQAQAAKTKKQVRKPRAQVAKPKKKEVEYIKKYPSPPKPRRIDIAKIKREEARRQQQEATKVSADEKLRKQFAEDIFPTPIGNMSKKDLFNHYKEMSDRINSKGKFDLFNPGSIVFETQKGNANTEVPVCMVEGGEDIGIPSTFGVTIPALLIRFCSNSTNPNPAISDMVGYTKKLLLSCGIQLYNYIIEPTEKAHNKIKNASYAKYVYVALDLNEDKEADD